VLATHDEFHEEIDDDVVMDEVDSEDEDFKI
jgi:hypothetical protein